MLSITCISEKYMKLVQIIGHTLGIHYRGNRDINSIISLYHDIKIFILWHHYKTERSACHPLHFSIHSLSEQLFP